MARNSQAVHPEASGNTRTFGGFGGYLAAKWPADSYIPDRTVPGLCETMPRLVEQAFFLPHGLPERSNSGEYQAFGKSKSRTGKAVLPKVILSAQHLWKGHWIDAPKPTHVQPAEPEPAACLLDVTPSLNMRPMRRTATLKPKLCVPRDSCHRLRAWWRDLYGKVEHYMRSSRSWTAVLSPP